MKFEETYLNDNILDALYDMRFDEMTPIQERCIPEILDGYDVLGVAQTGTGKTAAYLLPILSQLDDGDYPKDAINCVVMSPTRELAQQIDQAMQGFGYYLDGVSSVAVYGGNDGGRYEQELRGMRLGADVLIATPGRLLSHLKVGNLDLSRCSFFVLDEADRMLDMGFIDDIMKIVSQLPQSCQRIMFSATMPPKIRELAVTLLHDPVEVKIAVSKPAEKIRQSAYVCYEPQKLKIIQHLFKAGDLQRVIIFSGKKEKVKEVTRQLKQMHINCDQMHSDLSQQERDEVMYRFKSGQTDVLVATDIVARGIDIDDIRIVINYDVPHDAEDYVHRIGRTARADRDGQAITFVSDLDIYRFQQIEHFLGKEVEKTPLPDGLGEAPEYTKREKKRSDTRRHGRWHSRGNGSRNNQKRPSKKPKAKKPLLALAAFLIGCLGFISTSCSSFNEDNPYNPSDIQKSIVILYENDVHCGIDGYTNFAGLRYTVHQQSYTVTDVEVLSGDTWQAIDPERTYTIATTDYYSGGGYYDTLKDCTLLFLSNSLYRDVLSDYFETTLGGIIPPEYAQPQGRITILDD